MPADDDDDPAVEDDSGTGFPERNDLAGLVPAAFAVVRPRREEHDGGRLTAHSFAALRHRPVIVRAQGFVYRGVFAGCDESELYLKGELRWWVLPLETVTAVELDRERDVADDDADRNDDDPDAGGGGR